jgi:hypothetical protein
MHGFIDQQGGEILVGLIVGLGVVIGTTIAPDVRRGIIGAARWSVRPTRLPPAVMVMVVGLGIFLAVRS